MKTATIPESIRSIPRWIAWRARDGKKIPIAPKTGRPADVTSPKSWTTFEIASRSAGRLGGLGFCLNASDDVVGVDLDDCRDPATGRIEQWASRIVADLGSYTEVSPSGTGLKIFARGSWPGGKARKTATVEMYADSRFFTVTADHLPGTPVEIRERSAELTALYESLKSAEAPKAAAPRTGLSDAAVRILAARGPVGRKFSRLWVGDVAGVGSHSEADLAVCGRLAFFVGDDPERIERLFDESKLAERDKWLERPEYRESTIAAAIRHQRSFFVLKPGETYEAYNVAAGDVATEDRGVLVAREVCRDLLKRDADSAVCFTLARKLKGIDADLPAEHWEDAVAEVCRLTGREFEAVFSLYCDIHEAVLYAEGEGEMDQVWEAARREPYPTLFTEKYQFAASVGYHWSLKSEDRSFFFGRAALMRELGVDSPTVSRWIKRMEDRGLVVCIDENYSYSKKGTAGEPQEKTYRWIGPDREFA